MRGILFFMAFSLSCLVGVVHADNNEDIKKQINQIKKNNQYIYAEVTAETETEAKDLAEEILYSEINEWVAQQKKLSKSPNIVVNNKKELWTSVSLPRGNMFRSFLYVKKSDIIPADNATVIANTPTVETKQEKAEKTEMTIPKLVVEIADCTDYAVLAQKITNLKQTGAISDYGRYASLEDKDSYYMAVYNVNGKVVAVLTPGPERYNVKTGKSDSLGNYKGCGAIGFKVNE